MNSRHGNCPIVEVKRASGGGPDGISSGKRWRSSACQGWEPASAVDAMAPAMVLALKEEI